MTGASRTGKDPARRLLMRLLALAERAQRRGDARPASLPMTQASAADYHAATSWAEREHFHGAIEAAHRDAAITAHWQPHRDDPLLLRVTVADVEALARHLGVATLATRIAAAEALLQPWRQRFPVLDAVLEHWRQDRRVRGQVCEAAGDLADAARAVAALADEAGGERILRRESIRLFGDSKRLEALTPWLEVLLTGELATSGLDATQIWSALGLRKQPQPLLLAGRATLHLDDGSTLELPRRYLGIAPESLQSLVTPARYLLSVENLASFHDMASRAIGAPILVVYTGGMPSPTWRAAYQRLLHGLPADATALHWGDIDEGGLRIAAVLADAARAADRVLHPWMMSPADLPPDIVAAAPRASAATSAAMQRWAERAGWPGIAQALAQHGITLEQERLVATLPSNVDPPGQDCIPGKPSRRSS